MPSSPRIVQITGSYPPKTCGIGDYTHNLVHALRAQDTPVDVWTKAGQGNGAAREVVTDWNADGLRALGRLLRAERPQAAHLQYEPGIYDRHPAITLLPLLARRAGVPIVTTFHSLDGPAHWGRAHRLALLPLLLGSRDIVTCSQRQFLFLRRIPRLRDRVHLIPVGSNIPMIEKRPATHDGLRLLYFGFVWRGRNVELMLRTLAAVAKINPRATLTIIGGLRDDAYLQEILTLAGHLGVADKLTLAGELPAADISRAFHAADIVLLPYATGVSTGRTTLMTALAHAAPVVTLVVPDNLSPLFAQGENMMISLTADGDAPFIENAVRLALDPALRARIASGASVLAAQFSWPEIARQMRALPSYRESE